MIYPSRIRGNVRDWQAAGTPAAWVKILYVGWLQVCSHIITCPYSVPGGSFGRSFPKTGVKVAIHDLTQNSGDIADYRLAHTKSSLHDPSRRQRYDSKTSDTSDEAHANVAIARR